MKPCFNTEGQQRLSNRTLVPEPVSTGEEPVPLTPSQPETALERGTRDYAQAASGERNRWLVMWATRNRLTPALRFYQEQGIETFSPTETVYRKVEGKIVKKEQPLISNKFFVNISAHKLQQLRKDHPTNPFLIPVLDKTQGTEGTHPLMVISNSEMQNFIRLTTAGDEHVMLVTDPTRLSHLDPDKEYIVVEGKHKGLRGHRARYRKQERIVVKLGTLVFTTGYVPKVFVKAVREEMSEECVEKFS